MMENKDNITALPRRVLVSIGATAGFPELLHEVVSQDFVMFLAERGFTDLMVQCGPGLVEASSLQAKLKVPASFNINLFNMVNDMMPKMAETAAKPGKQQMGLIIAHAGSGTILEALRVATKLVVVPNPKLMDNHQEELAVELARQGYLTHGKLGHLQKAVIESEEKTPENWPPAPKADNPYPGGLYDIIEERSGVPADVKQEVASWTSFIHLAMAIIFFFVWFN